MALYWLKDRFCYIPVFNNQMCWFKRGGKSIRKITKWRTAQKLPSVKESSGLLRPFHTVSFVLMVNGSLCLRPGEQLFPPQLYGYTSVVGFYKRCTYLLQGLRRPEIHLTKAPEMTSHETSTSAGVMLGCMVTGVQGMEALCSIPPLSLHLLLSI